MKKYLFVSVLLMLSFNLFAQYDDDDEYSESPYSIYKLNTNDKGLYGLVRIADNKLIIPYKYSNISLFDMNYFVVYDSLKNAGLFSLKDNKILIACKYNEIVVEYQDFYPNDDNNPVILCGIKGIVKKDTNKITDFYSHKGNLLITTPDEIEFSLIHNPDTIIGVTYPYNDYDNKTGYFLYNAKTGALKSQKKCIITHYYPPFIVVKEKTGTGVINASSGSFIVKPECDSVKMDFTDIYIYKKGKTEVLVDGKPIFPKGIYGNISGSWYSKYLKARIWCVNKNGKWGGVDKNNNTVLPFEYDHPFNHSWTEFMVDSTWVSKNQKWGLINYKGDIVIPFQYDAMILGSYENYYKSERVYFDYYSAKKDNKWGCIRTNGALILPLEFDKPMHYSDSMLVVKEGKWHWIDKTNNEIVKFNFNADTSLYKNLSIADNSITGTLNGIKVKIDFKGNFAGILTDNGNVIPTICDAIYIGNVEAVKQFVNMGIDLNIKYKYHFKTQWVESNTDQFPIALLLTSPNAEINKNTIELFTLFLEHGAKLDTKNMEFSLIQYIVRTYTSIDEKIKMLQLYIDNKGDVNIKGRYQYTALMEIVQVMKVFNSYNCVDACRISKLLLDNGANPELKDSEGETPLKIAKDTGCKELVQLLKSYKNGNR